MTVREITTGQDSFLDIVANLVGVLIILVVIVGAHATSVWKDIEPSPEFDEQIRLVEKQAKKAAYTVATLEVDNHSLESDIQTQSMLAAVASEKRHQALVRLEIVRQELDRQRAELDRNKQEKFDRLQQYLKRKADLQQIVRETNALTINRPKSVMKTIDHFPTPISQTVFTNVIHVRLNHGRLVIVPLDELIDQMRSEWKVKADVLYRRNGVSTTIETVGPVDGFRLRYGLEAEGSRVQVVWGHVIGLLDSLGQPTANALRDGSAFVDLLRRHNPQETTVSIWFYPDGLKDHRMLKNWLHQRDFKVASWLQEPGQLISFGPQGSHISAQ